MRVSTLLCTLFAILCVSASLASARRFAPTQFSKPLPTPLKQCIKSCERDSSCVKACFIEFKKLKTQQLLNKRPQFTVPVNNNDRDMVLNADLLKTEEQEMKVASAVTSLKSCLNQCYRRSPRELVQCIDQCKFAVMNKVMADDYTIYNNYQYLPSSSIWYPPSSGSVWYPSSTGCECPCPSSAPYYPPSSSYYYPSSAYYPSSPYYPYYPSSSSYYPSSPYYPSWNPSSPYYPSWNPSSPYYPSSSSYYPSSPYYPSWNPSSPYYPSSSSFYPSSPSYPSWNPSSPYYPSWNPSSPYYPSSSIYYPSSSSYYPSSPYYPYYPSSSSYYPSSPYYPSWNPSSPYYPSSSIYYPSFYADNVLGDNDVAFKPRRRVVAGKKNKMAKRRQVVG